MPRGHRAIGLPLRRCCCCCWRRPVLVQRGELDVQVRREPVAWAQSLQQLLRGRAAQAAVLHLEGQNSRSEVDQALSY